MTRYEIALNKKVVKEIERERPQREINITDEQIETLAAEVDISFCELRESHNGYNERAKLDIHRLISEHIKKYILYEEIENTRNQAKTLRGHLKVIKPCVVDKMKNDVTNQVRDLHPRSLRTEILNQSAINRLLRPNAPDLPIAIIDNENNNE